MKIVSNSTPLIALSRINELGLLHAIFDTIIVPDAVYKEIAVEGVGRPGVEEIVNAPWIVRQQVQNALAVSMLQAELDDGEAEAVVLAKELEADYLFLDEKKARRVARILNIRIMGTVGVLGLAAKKGLISNLDDTFDLLRQNGFRFTEEIRERVKREIQTKS
jgi:predicted nucleic acid-binding protein